jgi:hypothetical protein
MGKRTHTVPKDATYSSATYSVPELLRLLVQEAVYLPIYTKRLLCVFLSELSFCVSQ